MPEFEPYRTVAEIEKVVSRFESCEYKPEQFFHARHLTVAAWYFLHFDRKTAEDRMRAGLLKFIRHHRKNGYHVTITEFWLQQVEGILSATEPPDGIVLRVNQTVERLSNKYLIYEYFTRARLESPEAKAEKIAPDLKLLSGPERGQCD
ncbi:MAG: hypothetical protein ACRD5M_08500 [Candidatus Acidiferrales bacterium]